MAEWFKATDLRPVISDAWVRTPLAAKNAVLTAKNAVLTAKNAVLTAKNAVLTAKTPKKV